VAALGVRCAHRLPEREVEEFTEEIRGVSRGGATMEVIGDDEFGEDEEE